MEVPLTLADTIWRMDHARRESFVGGAMALISLPGMWRRVLARMRAEESVCMRMDDFLSWPSPKRQPCSGGFGVTQGSV